MIKRRFYQLMFLGAWCGTAGTAYWYWFELVRFCANYFPNDTSTVLIFALLFCGLAAILLYSMLIDRLAPLEAIVKTQSEEEKKGEAERRVALALKEGRRDAAVRIYEEAGLYMSGLKIAEELQDYALMARLSWRMGHYFRARKYYLQLDDFKSAADMSVLMSEIKPARELYARAAALCGAGARAVDEAMLWDRARDWPRAARLYEDAGDFERAAECHELLGNPEQHKSCVEQARALRAYEERTQTRDRNSILLQAREKKLSFASQAKTFELKGDLFAAGVAYREAGQWMEAAICFEKIEEWERCARAYDQAGLRDRAELVKMNIDSAPRREPSQPKTIAPLPSPRDNPPQMQFVPISQLAPRPTTGNGHGSLALIDPQALEQMAEQLRKGNFLEAARCAEEAQNLLVAAALFEHSGDLINAAQSYRRIGRIEEAAYCLQQADHPHEAAMMALSIGREEDALKTLLKAVSEKDDLYSAFMLIELLIQWGRHDDALELLRKKIAPGLFTKEHAEPYYRVARLFEKYNAYAPAHQLYSAMLQGGAISKELEERAARMEKMMRLPAKSEPHVQPADPTAVNTLLQMHRESWVADMHSLDDVHSVETQDADQEQFVFLTPLDLKKKSPNHRGLGPHTSVPMIERDLSLFGSVSPSKRGLLKHRDGVSRKNAAATAEESPFNCDQRYELLCEIAKGGMGVIYEALDIVLGRKVALKLIQGSAASDEMKQFLLEARAIACLNHPNIVTIFDVGMMDYKHYISMELVRGGTLADYLYSRRRLPLAEGLRIFVETARGLHAAHQAGVVHRDIKPGNILLNQEHTVKIVDFGLAKFARKQAEGSEAQSDTLFKSAGTPGYMAPEQIRGDEVLPRSDIYSMGIVLFYMLAGRPPHRVAERSGTYDIIDLQLNGHLPSLKQTVPDVPEGIEQLYRYCTATDPDQRYQSIETFLPCVEEWLVKLAHPALV